MFVVVVFFMAPFSQELEPPQNPGRFNPDWMGSHVYRDTAGYYDTLRPSKQVPGWAYNSARNTEYDPASPPTWGKPTCKE